MSEVPEIITPEVDTDRIRTIHRTIASALILSSDGYLLMGRKDPGKGGVYPDVWHIPGGGTEEGESLEDAVVREVLEEVGLKISKDYLLPIPEIGEGASEKTFPTGEKVWCEMKFHRFEVRLPETAEELFKKLKHGDDLVELRWFSPEELEKVDQIPGGKEFFIRQGYIR